MTDIKLDIKWLRDMANEVVDDYGAGYIYPRDRQCRYVDAGKCGCLIGHILHRAGVPLEELVDFDRREIGNAARVLPFWADDMAKQWASDAQDRQDDGMRWGEAIVSADRLLLDRILDGYPIV